MAHCSQLSINEPEERKPWISPRVKVKTILRYLLADHLVPSVAKSTVTLQTGKFTERLKLKVVLIS